MSVTFLLLKSAACWYLCQFVSEVAARSAFWCSAVEIHQQSFSHYLSAILHFKAQNASVPFNHKSWFLCGGPALRGIIPACIIGSHTERNYHPERNTFILSGWKCPVNSGCKQMRPFCFSSGGDKLKNAERWCVQTLRRSEWFPEFERNSNL